MKQKSSMELEEAVNQLDDVIEKKTNDDHHLDWSRAQKKALLKTNQQSYLYSKKADFLESQLIEEDKFLEMEQSKDHELNEKVNDYGYDDSSEERWN